MIKILIGSGKKIDKSDLFDTIKIRRSMKSLCSTFSLQTSEFSLSTNIIGNINCLLMLKEKDKYVKVLDGYIDKINGSLSVTSDSLIYMGRDKTSYIADCDVLMDSSSISGTNIEDILQEILTANGYDFIKVINNTGRALIISSAINFQIGENLLAIFQNICYSSQVVFRSNYNGDIVLENAATTVFHTPLTINSINDRSKNNLKNIDISIDNSKQYGTYQVACVSNKGADEKKSMWSLDSLIEATEKHTFDKNENSVNSLGAVEYNKEVDKKRIKVITVTKDPLGDYARKRCLWAMNNAKEESFKYTCTVVGLTDDDGKLWRPNTKVRVTDNKVGFKNQELLLLDVEFSISKTDGYSTQLTFTYPDAFTFGVKPTNPGKGKGKGEGLGDSGIWPLMTAWTYYNTGQSKELKYTIAQIENAAKQKVAKK